MSALSFLLKSTLIKQEEFQNGYVVSKFVCHNKIKNYATA